MALSFISNLAILFFFKYFDFAADTVRAAVCTGTDRGAASGI